MILLLRYILNSRLVYPRAKYCMSNFLKINNNRRFCHNKQQKKTFILKFESKKKDVLKKLS